MVRRGDHGRLPTFVRSWQYDQNVKHDGCNNMYCLMCGATKTTLLPSKEIAPKPKAGEGTNLLSRAQFEEEVTETKMFCVLIAKEGTEAE